MASAIQVQDAAPFIRLDQSLGQAKDSFVELSGTLSLTAPLTRLTSSRLTSGADFVSVESGARLASTTSQALLQFQDSTVNAYTLLSNNSGLVDLVGAPLPNAVDSHPTFDFAAVESAFGGQIVSTSTAPFVGLDGGTLTSRGQLFLLSGGSEVYRNLSEPLRTGGTLLEAGNGATIDVAGNALRMDLALLEATKPIIRLIGLPTKEKRPRRQGVPPWTCSRAASSARGPWWRSTVG
jgi:hypothetical protein